MGLFDIFKKKKTTGSNKPTVEEFTLQSEREWEQALKRKEPFVNHESAGAGELNEKILLMLAKANKFDLEEAAGEPNHDDAPLSAEEEKEWAAMKRRFSSSTTGEVLGYEESMAYFIYNWKEKTCI